MMVDVICPEDSMGDVIGDLNARRGQIGELGDKPGGLKTVKAYVPLAEMFSYVSKLRGMTKVWPCKTRPANTGVEDRSEPVLKSVETCGQTG